MKVYVSPRAQEQMSDASMVPFLQAAFNEMNYFGSDEVKQNPFWENSRSILWNDKSCNLAIYCNTANDYALLFENPHHPHMPNLPDSYYEGLILQCEKIYLI